MKLSIVIPAHNEEERLGGTLSTYGRFFLREFHSDYEMIVVVNNCKDETETVAREAVSQNPQVKVLVETGYVGKGGAVQTGMLAAAGDVVAFVDADGSTGPESLMKMVEAVGTDRCVIGSRWVPGAVIEPHQSFIRRAASRMLNRIVVKCLFGLPVEDSQCGAKAFSKNVLKEILASPLEQGWAFDIELLCRIHRRGFSIQEVPIEWNHKSGNATAFLIMCLQMAGSVMRVKRRLDAGKFSS